MSYCGFFFPRGSLVGQARRRTGFASDFGIGEALPDDVGSYVLESGPVMGEFSEVVPEHLFVEIAEKVEGLNADIGAFQLALEQAPEVFESVGVHLSVNVAFSMVNDLVFEPMPLESLVGHERIGVDRAPDFDVGADVGLEGMLFAIADYGGANFSPTFQNAHDGGFIFGASLSNPATVFVGVHEAGRAANESFVYFDFAAGTAEFQERAVLHSESDAMEHEPCGLLSDAESAAHFIRANAVLAIRNHPNGDKPLVQTNRRILKDGPDLDRELPMMVDGLALPLVLILEEDHVFPATSGAGYNAIRPAQLDHEVEAVVRVGEVNHSLLESLWSFHDLFLNSRADASSNSRSAAHNRMAS